MLSHGITAPNSPRKTHSHVAKSTGTIASFVKTKDPNITIPISVMAFKISDQIVEASQI